jgi:isoleucyl-tRNA synthetase
LAPFTPFIAEEIYRNLTGEESVHLSDWPSVGTIDTKLHEDMALARKICEAGHAVRKEKGIKVRQPLRNAKCQVQNVRLDEELLRLIRDELNVKKVEWVQGKESLPQVELDTTLTDELKDEGEARELVRNVQELRKQTGCALDEKITIVATSWPKNFTDYIKKETLAKELKKGDNLEVKRLK